VSRGQNGKSTLRETVLARREAMDPGARDSLSSVIFEEVMRLDCYWRSGVVLSYVGFGSEPRTDAFVRRVLDDEKVLLLPRVNRDEQRLNLYEVKDPARNLVDGTWGIREPNPDLCSRAEPAAIDFALVPGVAFDARGARLGYGGGYYDRLLAGCTRSRPSLVAAAFELQVVDEVPLEEHDVRVDLIVTEGGKYAANLPSADS
jgi:5-formyltetrahydrofolate cyclo-ligase